MEKINQFKNQHINKLEMLIKISLSVVTIATIIAMFLNIFNDPDKENLMIPGIVYASLYYVDAIVFGLMVQFQHIVLLPATLALIFLTYNDKRFIPLNILIIANLLFQVFFGRDIIIKYMAAHFIEFLTYMVRIPTLAIFYLFYVIYFYTRKKQTALEK